MHTTYQVCSRCVMDTTAPDIRFDADGICSYCREFLHRAGAELAQDPQTRARKRDRFIAEVKAAGAGKAYDCVIGVSGGVDSSWSLVQAVRLGLRPLPVHMDNGWNSELAQNNIANLVRGLGLHLYTHVIDWNEYRDLMQAFFDADVIDVELLYDNAMAAVNYQQAARHGLRHILAGTNQATEGMRIPASWVWFKFDRKNIRGLGRRFRRRELRTFPAIGTLGYLWYEHIRGIRWISFLDYFEYNKQEALEVLQREFGYKPYPYKHYESIFTRFYQGYILPQKFGVDKRRVHFSTLIVSGQMTREEALRGLEGIPYASEKALEEDKLYFVKKMGWSLADLDAYIGRPAVAHSHYPSERPLWDRLQRWRRQLRFARG
jgi:N-acetyl sugar amidotransferase